MPRTPSVFALLAVAALAPSALAQGPLFLSVIDNSGNGVPGFSGFSDNQGFATDLAGSTGAVVFDLLGGDLDAMHRLDNGDWLVSVNFAGNYGGTSFLDGDIVQIDPTTETVVGTFLPESIFASGSPAPDITGVTILPNGNLALSARAGGTINSTTFDDGDILELDLGSGATSILISQADIFDDGDGEISGIHAFDDGTFLLSFSSTTEMISGTEFRDGDAFLYNPADDSATLVWDEDIFTGSNSYDIDALYFEGLIPSPGAAALLGLAFVGVRRRRA